MSAFFANLDDVELSDDEDDTHNANDSAAAAEPAETEAGAPATSAKSLPSVDDLFGAKELAKPAFLTTAAEVERDMAFDLRPEPEEPKPWLNKRPLARSSEVKEEQARAAAVKQQQNMSLAAEIAAAATSLSQTYKVAAFDEDAGAFKPRLLTEMHKRPKAAAAAGRANGDDDLDPEETGPDKKKRGDPHKSFNAKEKRKRELGQSSRDKSYVEEEKRILRAEMTRKAGYGFD